jgi:hypothetical protein
MLDEGRCRWLTSASPGAIIALIALVFAMSGSAVAATNLVSGDKLIKKGSLSGNRLRAHSVTGRQIRLSTLGKVPSAAKADSATHAASADTATTADSATQAAKADHATTAGSAAPTGAAGGSLSGAYPGPTIAAGAVGADELAAFPGARVRSSDDQYVGNNISTTLHFDTADTNVGGVWDPGQNDRLTARVAGQYLVTASVWWSPDTLGTRILRILVNGPSGDCIAHDSAAPTPNGDLQQNVSTVYHLDAGEYVIVRVIQDSGKGLGSLQDSKDAPVLSLNWIGK